MKSPLSEAEVAVLRAEIQKATQAALMTAERQAVLYDSASVDKLNKGATLWAMDPAAASCDELVMADALPSKSNKR